MKGKEKEQLYQKRNYDHYHFSMKELLKYMGQALALCIMADYLFYKSKWVLLLMLPDVYKRQLLCCVNIQNHLNGQMDVQV